MTLSLSLPAAQAHQMQVIDTGPGHDAAQTWAAACKPDTTDFETPLLLLPDGYSMIPSKGVQEVCLFWLR
jgi:hypothetical protein